MNFNVIIRAKTDNRRVNVKRRAIANALGTEAKFSLFAVASLERRIVGSVLGAAMRRERPASRGPGLFVCLWNTDGFRQF